MGSDPDDVRVGGLAGVVPRSHAVRYGFLCRRRVRVFGGRRRHSRDTVPCSAFSDAPLHRDAGGVAAVDLPGQFHRTFRRVSIERAGRSRQHRPVEVILVGDGHDAVAYRERFQYVRGPALPLQRCDLAGNHVDQHRVLDSTSFQSERGAQRRKHVPRFAVRGQPVGDDLLAGSSAEAVREKRPAGPAAKRSGIRGRELKCRVELGVREKRVGILQRLEYGAGREVGGQVLQAVNEAEVVVLVAVSPRCEQPHEGANVGRPVVEQTAWNVSCLDGVVGAFPGADGVELVVPEDQVRADARIMAHQVAELAR